MRTGVPALRHGRPIVPAAPGPLPSRICPDVARGTALLPARLSLQHGIHISHPETGRSASPTGSGQACHVVRPTRALALLLLIVPIIRLLGLSRMRAVFRRLVDFGYALSVLPVALLSAPAVSFPVPEPRPAQATITSPTLVEEVGIVLPASHARGITRAADPSVPGPLPQTAHTSRPEWPLPATADALRPGITRDAAHTTYGAPDAHPVRAPPMVPRDAA